MLVLGEADLERSLDFFQPPAKESRLNFFSVFSSSVVLVSSSLVLPAALPALLIRINPPSFFDFLTLSSGLTTATGTGECWRQYLDTLLRSMPLNSESPRVPTIKSDGWYMEIMCWMVSCTLPMTNSITTLIYTCLSYKHTLSIRNAHQPLTAFSSPLVLMILFMT